MTTNNLCTIPHTGIMLSPLVLGGNVFGCTADQASVTLEDKTP